MVELNWFSRAFILNLHSLWMPIWAIWEMLEGQLSWMQMRPVSLCWWKGVWETRIHSWVLPGQPSSLCKHPSPRVVFCPPLSNRLLATAAGIKGIHLPENMGLLGLCCFSFHALHLDSSHAIWRATTFVQNSVVHPCADFLGYTLWHLSVQGYHAYSLWSK